MRRHLRTHSGDKSNKCNQCDYATSCVDVLRTHLNTHCGEKQMQPMRLCILSGRPFKNAQWRKVKKCNQCDFASSRAGNLRTHLKTHSWEKPNKCNQCDYASSQASNLRTHLKTHSGEKSNKCNQCDFASALACYLRTHLKTQSQTNVQRASVLQPSQAGNLWGHLKLHGGGKQVQITPSRRYIDRHPYFGTNYTKLVWGTVF